MSALVARSQERARLAARLGAAWRVRLKGPTAADGRHAKPRVVRPNCSVSRLSFYASLFLWYCTHVRCFYPGQLEPAQNPIEISLMLRCCKQTHQGLATPALFQAADRCCRRLLVSPTCGDYGSGWPEALIWLIFVKSSKKYTTIGSCLHLCMTL